LGLALGKLPGLRIDRAGIALVGATLFLVCGILSLGQAVRAVNYETIVLLFGMMVVAGYLRLSGFFERPAPSTLARCYRSLGRRVVTVGLAGGCSAFLVNDVVAIARPPVVLHLTRRLRLNPVPYLIGLATASNIGSSATITGNPQNIHIGAVSEIPYLRFAV